MSKAVTAINHLLSQDAALIAVVPAARIKSGPLPQDTTLPAISVSHVSTTRRQNVPGTGTAFCSAVVQVTVIAGTYPTLRSTLDLVVAALPRSRGTANGVDVDAVIPLSAGPDFTDEAGLFMGSHDFSVTYNE